MALSPAAERPVVSGVLIPPPRPRTPLVGRERELALAEDLPEQRFLTDELHEQVRRAVATLPPAQRQVVMLRDLHGLSSDEVCDLLHLTDANQRVLLHRGRSKVRAALERYCVGRAEV